MTETKTFAQERLKKLIQSYKEARKHKRLNSAPSLKSLQQSGDDSSKKTLPKRDTNSRIASSPNKANSKNKNVAILKNLNKNGLPSSNAGIECPKFDPLKDTPLSSRLKNRKLQSPNKKSYSLEKHVNPPPNNNKEAIHTKVKNIKQLNDKGRTEKHQETSCQPAEKRRSDHENVEKKKITKNQKSEDSSKNVVSKKSKNVPSNVTDAITLQQKLSFMIDSYSSFDDDSPPLEKETKTKTENNIVQVKEPFNNKGKSIKFTIPKKAPELRLKEKEREIKDKGITKQLSVSPSKTKLQARLQKVKAEMKEKLKEMRKESFSDKDKDGGYHFIESMDWEPTNDLILRSIRDEVDPSKEMMEWQDICENDYNFTQEIGESSLYIVVDTNVLIRNIDLIKKLSKAVIRGFKIIQVIPWQVLKELDNLKSKVDYKNVNASARIAIRFLSEATISNALFNVVFQSQSKHFEECPGQFLVEVPDDHLIKCCFQFKQKGHKVVLLSNDVNLRVKTTTNNIQAVDDKWILKMLELESKSIKQSIHCFENEPKEFGTGCDDNLAHFIHKTTLVILSSLYNVVILKYKEQYDDLWPLWVPKEPHFPEITNFMTSTACFQPYWIKLNAIKDFFVKNKSYDHPKPADIERLGRNFISLLKKMCADNFIPNDLALQFFKELSFLKCFPVVDWSNCNYIEGSYMLAQKYLKDTEDCLNEFVAYISALYAEKGSLLYRNEEVLHHIDINLKLIDQFRSAMSQFHLIQEQQIPEDCEAAKTLHKAICEFLGDKMDLSRFPIFSPEDVVEYVNPNRNIFMPAISWLMNQESSLFEIKSKLV